MRKKGTKILNRTSSSGTGVSAAQKVSAANRWRDQYNPLRGLSISRVVSLLEEAQCGQFADIQWAYSFIERRDADLLALVERRTGSLLEMDWNIKPVPADRMPAGVSDADVENQIECLRAAYEQIENLYEAIEHLAMPAFRGYAHCQLVKGDYYASPGEATRIEPIDQWNIARDGYRGPWYWNPEAKSTQAKFLGEDNRINQDNFLIRECKRPINEIAFIKWVRQNLSQKDWDAFIEIFGIPGCVVIGPANVPAGKENEYKNAGEDIAEGASGYLPNGADVKFPSEVRGNSPFRPHLDYLTEKLVLAGTGGLLTMLTASGSGTLAGSAHMEAFKLISRADARRVSEVFQKQFDKKLLSSQFRSKPIVAYFDLASREEKNVGDVVAHAGTLSSAGYQMEVGELQEKTGYTLTLKPSQQTEALQVSPPGEDASHQRVPNRSGTSPARRPLPLLNSNRSAIALSPVEGLISSGKTAVAKAIADDLQPIRNRLETIIQVEDPELRNAALKKLQSDLPAMLLKINANPSSAKVLEDTLAAAMANGISESVSAVKSVVESGGQS